jgi:Plant transposon protein
MDSSDGSTDSEASTGGSASSGDGFGAVARFVIMELEEELGEERNDRFWKTKKRIKKSSFGPQAPPSKRRSFDNQGAYQCIMRDHLGPDVLFGKEFSLLFRLSRPRVELIINAIMNSGNPFFQSFRTNRFGKKGACIEAKVLLPLKVLAYGVAPHTFCDYFQMSISQCGVCCRQFNRIIPQLFSTIFNRLPTTADLAAVNQLHSRVHGVEGMLGSLDCMHTYWKNCPVAWQQSFKGKQSGPTIVLEAAADYHLWFWHASYGYAGAMNDLNILNMSPLLERMTNGSFKAVEVASGVCPFKIDESTDEASFDRMYLLVDGIYPKYSRFVRGFKAPITDEEVRFTGWQESARKDIERAFGVLQCKWKVLSFPIHAIDQRAIANMVATCIILHNMCVSDRVMGSVEKDYVPSTVAEKETAGDVTDSETVNQNRNHRRTVATAVATFEPELATTIAEREEWKMLKDPDEWARLQRALINYKGRGVTETTVDGV